MRSGVPVWLLSAAAAVVLFILVTIVVRATGSVDSFQSFLTTSGPAWIQAIGSIAAIIAASSIANAQASSARQLETERRAAEEIRNLEVIKALMARSIGLAKDVVKATSSQLPTDYIQITVPLMIDTSKTLHALPIFEIPDGLLALDVLTVGRALDSLADLTETIKAEMREHATVDVPSTDEYSNLGNEILEISQAAFDETNRLIRTRKSVLNASA